MILMDKVVNFSLETLQGRVCRKSEVYVNLKRKTEEDIGRGILKYLKSYQMEEKMK